MPSTTSTAGIVATARDGRAKGTVSANISAPFPTRTANAIATAYAPHGGRLLRRISNGYANVYQKRRKTYEHEARM